MPPKIFVQILCHITRLNKIITPLHCKTLTNNKIISLTPTNAAENFYADSTPYYETQ
ncbi:MAG: hypothetical protein IJT21_01490 [Synergistaceae bacterium]|nr:hypothetical protein [Synergistaceae bacterium]